MSGHHERTRPLCDCPSCERERVNGDGCRRLEQNNLDALRLMCSGRDIGQLARATAEIRVRVFASVGRYVEGVRR